MREAPPGHVCVVLLTGLGEVVHRLPVVNALKRAWPATRITWVVEPMPAGILSPHPAVDQVIIYEKTAGLRGVRDRRRRMAAERFDLALNLNIYFKSVWPLLFSGAPVRWTFGRDRARDGVWLAPDTGPVHIARAVGTPVVGLFGHTNPWRAGPYGAFEQLWVDACTEAGTPPDPAAAVPKHGRMERIDPAAVAEKVAQALATDSPRQPR